MGLQGAASADAHRDSCLKLQGQVGGVSFCFETHHKADEAGEAGERSGESLSWWTFEIDSPSEFAEFARFGKRLEGNIGALRWAAREESHQ